MGHKVTKLVSAKTADYLGFLLLTTLIAGLFAFFWWFSVLGFGFAPGPVNPTIKYIAKIMVLATYIVGLPALLLGQVASPILWFYGRTREAYVVPLACMGLFLLGASTALFMYTKL